LYEFYLLKAIINHGMCKKISWTTADTELGTYRQNLEKDNVVQVFQWSFGFEFEKLIVLEWQPLFLSNFVMPMEN
jgi:hypothetical protein